MDDTIEDEPDIPFLKNADEIPVHSTPIKGEKVPLPSTRHVSRFLKHKSCLSVEDTTSESIQSGEKVPLPSTRHVSRFLKHKSRLSVDDTTSESIQSGEKVPLPSTRHVSKFLKHKSRLSVDDTTTESIQSVCASNVMDTKGQGHEMKDGCHDRLTSDLPKHSINRFNIPKQTIPQPDRDLDISNQDNLRPKPREYHMADHYRHDADRMSQIEAVNHGQKDRNSRQVVSLPNTNRHFDRGKQSRNSQSNSSSVNDQSKHRSQMSSPDNNNALSSYRHSKTDSKLCDPKSDGTSYSVKISSYRRTSVSPSRDATIGSPLQDQTASTSDRQTVHVNSHVKNIPENVNSEDFILGRKGTLKDRGELSGGTQTLKVDSHMKSLSENDSPEDSFLERKRFTFDGSKYGSRLNNKQNSSFAELENVTIAKQRQEVQMLVSELKDRDRELSDMMSSHQQQLIAWEQDRQRVTSLEQKSHQLEDEVQNKSSQLRSVIVTLKAVKERESDNKAELEKIKRTMEELRSEKLKAKEDMEKYRVENGELQNRLDDLSHRLGDLQARETELTTNIKSKEKDLSYATSQMKELSTRLQQLDLRCKECQDREKGAVKERDEWKHKCETSHKQIHNLTAELEMKRNQCSRLLDENKSARNQLALVQKETGERERCKDDIIESMRVKQERTDTQLKNLRELYERQLKEVSALQMQLDTSKGIIHKQQNSMEQLQFSQSDRSSEITPDRTRAKQRLNFSPQNRLSHQHRSREPDYSHYTQSSGYQSQLSDNQTGIAAGNQGVSTGSDVKIEPVGDFQPTMINTNERQTQPIHPVNKLLNEKEKSALNQDDVHSPRNVHEEYLWHKSVETHNKDNQPLHISDEARDSDYRHRLRSPPLVRDRTNTPSPHRQTHGQTNSESPSSRIVIKQTTVSMYPSDNPHTNQPSHSNPTPNIPNFSDSTDNQGRSSSQGEQNRIACENENFDQFKNRIFCENENVNKLRQDNGCASSSEPGLTEAQHGGIEHEFVFENKLRSFLEDIDIEIDDSIWDDKPDRTQSISTVDCSPSSKLQKLLLESRMMLESLEKSADVPLQNISFNANDTLENPNFDESTTAATTENNTASGNKS